MIPRHTVTCKPCSSYSLALTHYRLHDTVTSYRQSWLYLPHPQRTVIRRASSAPAQADSLHQTVRDRDQTSCTAAQHWHSCSALLSTGRSTADSAAATWQHRASAQSLCRPFDPSHGYAGSDSEDETTSRNHQSKSFSLTPQPRPPVPHSLQAFWSTPGRSGGQLLVLQQTAELDTCVRTTS